MATQNQKWFQRKPLPNRLEHPSFFDVIKRDANSVFIRINGRRSFSFWQYIVSQDKFIELKDHIPFLWWNKNGHRYDLIHNESTNDLYAICRDIVNSHSLLYSINLVSKAMRVYNLDINPFKTGSRSAVNSRYVVDGKLYTFSDISSSENARIQTNIIEISSGKGLHHLHFGLFSRNDSMVRLLTGKKMIYISSISSVLMIGGVGSDHPWIYSLSTNKWKKIVNISFKRTEFGIVLSSNQRYILLFGGKTNIKDKKAQSDIHVLDMKIENRWKLRPSNLSCSRRSNICYAFGTGGMEIKDDVLVIGYIRELFQSKAFENIQLPPTYIMMMVAERYSAEMIHLIYNNGDHQGIHLNDILSSLCN